MMENNPTIVDKRESQTDSESEDGQTNDNDQPSISEYSCPYCSYTDNEERWVRVHITSSSDTRHDGRHGFSPNVTVDALDSDGNVVDQPRGIPAQADDPGSVTTELLPDDLEEEKEEIILTAVRNPSIDSYSELQDLVNEKSDSEVSYNKVYYTVNTYMSKPDSQQTTGQTTQDKSTSKQFEDLTDKQKSTLIELARDERENLNRTRGDLSDDAGVDATYVSTVESKYGDLIDEILDWDSLPEPKAVLDSNEGFTTDDAAEIARLGIDDPDSETLFEDLSEHKREIVSALAEQPQSDPAEIRDSVDASPVEFDEIRTQHEDIIERKRREVLLQPLVDASGDSELAERFSQLTPKQKSTAVELAKESDPSSPDREPHVISGYAGIHPTYLGKIPDKVVDVAELIRDANGPQTTPTTDSTDPSSPDDSSTETETETETTGTATDPTASDQSEAQETQSVPTSGSPQAPEQLELPESDDDSQSDSATRPAAEVSSAQEVLDDVESVLQTAESLERVADSQLESSDGEIAAAHGSKATASELRSRLEDLLNEHRADSVEE